MNYLMLITLTAQALPMSKSASVQLSIYFPFPLLRPLKRKVSSS